MPFKEHLILIKCYFWLKVAKRKMSNQLASPHQLHTYPLKLGELGKNKLELTSIQTKLDADNLQSHF